MLIGQGVQALIPATDEYEPAGQLTQTAALLPPVTVEYVPAAQLMHTVEAVAPTVLEYAPAWQLVHTLPNKYVPAGHAMLTQTLSPAFVV